jgi:hypothetical protein
MPSGGNADAAQGSIDREFYITEEGQRKSMEPSSRSESADRPNREATPPRQQQQPEARPPRQGRRGQHSPHYQPPPGNRYGGKIGCSQPATAQSVQRQLAKLHNMRNEATKIAQARKAIQRLCLLSIDVRALMETLTYERDRFKLAKFAYDYVYDVENFHLVFEAFSGRHYPQELQRYIQQHRPVGVQPHPPRQGPPQQGPPQQGPPPQQPPAQGPPNQQPPPQPNPMPGYNGPVGCELPSLNSGELGRALESIRSKSFSSTQLTVAKQVISNNCLRTSQVRQIISIFSFESDKLKLAKFAYPYTYDQGNYYRINDVFSFESSVEELAAFINRMN